MEALAIGITAFVVGLVLGYFIGIGSSTVTTRTVPDRYRATRAPRVGTKSILDRGKPRPVTPNPSKRIQ